MLLKMWPFAAAAAIASASIAMAAPTAVTIVDPNHPGRAAAVGDSRLAVQEVAPATFFHAVFNLTGSECQPVATPPARQALIVRQVHVASYAGSASGTPFVSFHDNPNCQGFSVGAVVVTLFGNFLYSFDPGLAIPAGSSFSVRNSSGYAVDIFVDG